MPSFYWGVLNNRKNLRLRLNFVEDVFNFYLNGTLFEVKQLIGGRQFLGIGDFKHLI